MLKVDKMIFRGFLRPAYSTRVYARLEPSRLDREGKRHVTGQPPHTAAGDKTDRTTKLFSGSPSKPRAGSGRTLRCQPCARCTDTPPAPSPTFPHPCAARFGPCARFSAGPQGSQAVRGRRSPSRFCHARVLCEDG